MLAGVLSAPSNQVWGHVGRVNLKLFSFLGPHLAGLLQISNSRFVRAPSMLSAGGITAATASFWSRERACRGKENPVFKAVNILYPIGYKIGTLPPSPEPL